MDAAKETEAWTRKYSAEQVEDYLSDLKKRGMEIYYPTPAEYAQWTSIREKVWQEVAEQQKGKIDIELANKILRCPEVAKSLNVGPLDRDDGVCRFAPA